MPFLLLLMLLLHYGEGKRCSNFRRWCRRYDAVFTAVGAAITLWRGQMLLKFSPLVSALCYPFFLPWVRPFTQLNDVDFVSFCGTNTLLLLVVGAPQHDFCLQVLDTTHPVLAPPLHFLTLAAPLQVVSFGDDATLSRSVRPSTRSRRGRRGPDAVQVKSSLSLA